MANLSRLPVPTQEQYQWQYEGACNDVETELFFSPAFERGSRREAREGEAKSYCAVCPVALQCLEHALSAEEPFGVWGGTTSQERSAILRQLRSPDPVARPA
ncbi:WhiB family transcriptional regulator [Solicola sp. PLA-1-18]|uniref:WhiB family transcriptional regulator n=1 Tax=Solicola sp. PLA-1-18 TaxID=3380532 RepID=UPI003B76454A